MVEPTLRSAVTNADQSHPTTVRQAIVIDHLRQRSAEERSVKEPLSARVATAACDIGFPMSPACIPAMIVGTAAGVTGATSAASHLSSNAARVLVRLAGHTQYEVTSVLRAARVNETLAPASTSGPGDIPGTPRRT